MGSHLLFQDDQDEYKYQEEEEEDEQYEDYDMDREDGPSTRGRRAGTRRSTRAATINGSNNKPADDFGDWRGERRSTRLGAPAEMQLDAPPPKRARTEDSTASSLDGTAPAGGNGLKVKLNGAAAIKPTETVVEAVAGKKKSKFWVYAVEPVVAPQAHPPAEDYDMVDVSAVGKSHQNGASSSNTDDASSPGVRTGGESYATSVQESSSPSPSMDET